jgi:hypothetical protein
MLQYNKSTLLFSEISPPLWPNKRYWCCVFLTLQISLMCIKNYKSCTGGMQHYLRRVLWTKFTKGVLCGDLVAYQLPLARKPSPLFFLPTFLTTSTWSLKATHSHTPFHINKWCQQIGGSRSGNDLSEIL